MAIFGPQIEDTFMLLHKSRRHIEVACQMLAQRVDDDEPANENTRALYEQLRHDMSDHGGFEPERDRVGQMLKKFQADMEATCRPVIDKGLKPSIQ
jgi:hypothetical protein